MSIDIDGIIDQFMCPIIPVISEAPTYQNIAGTNIILNTNAASVHSNLRDGKHRNLISKISDAPYNKIPTKPFAKPTNRLGCLSTALIKSSLINLEISFLRVCVTFH